MFSTIQKRYAFLIVFMCLSFTSVWGLSPSITTVNDVPNPSVFGQSVTITATVSGSGPTPTGTVTLTGSFGSLVLVLDGSGQASITNSALPVGSNTITATYNGDANYTPSTGTVTQVVNQAATTTTLTSSPNPSIFGQAVTITATVAAVPPGSGLLLARSHLREALALKLLRLMEAVKQALLPQPFR